MQTSDLLTYLEQEKAYTEADIREIDALSLPERVARGLALTDLRLVRQLEEEVLLSCEENNTRWRPGDWVELQVNGQWEVAIIAENSPTEVLLLLQTPRQLRPTDHLLLQSNKSQLLDPIIQSLQKLQPGAPGASFLDLLTGRKLVKQQQYGSVELSPAQLAPADLNSSQRLAALRAARRPSLLAVQGPPGTGKTHVLAVVAQQLARHGQPVVVLAHTHQAVNNCLNAIRALDSSLALFKIGEVLKSNGLDPSIETVKYKEFQKLYKQKKRPQHCVIGLSYYAALIHLGLRSSGFAPTAVLVDEAGQIPLTYGAVLGSLGAGSVLLFGDDAQMPPIYHPKLEQHVLSRSLFQQVRAAHPDAVIPLDTTYRLNDQLSGVIGQLYYPAAAGGSFLHSALAAQPRRLQLPLPPGTPPVLARALQPATSLVWVNNATPNNDCEQVNDQEAEAIAALVATCLVAGLPPSQVAVVSPFRRQVLALRAALRQRLPVLPPELIVDTVERLQGSSVEVIIVSYAANQPAYLTAIRRFLLSSNRLNVALSRARSKAIFFVSDTLLQLPQLDIQSELSQLSFLREAATDYLLLAEF
jgi:DNA replication ATP-dependent helicase Dna2